MSQASVLDQNVDEIFEELFDETSEPILIVNPSGSQLKTTITTAVEYGDELPELRIIAREQLVKEMTDNFITTSEAVDLIQQDKLSVRITEDVNRSSMVILEDAVISLLQLDGQTEAMRTEDEDLVERSRDTLMSVWENSDDFSFRTPALSEVEETLEEEIGAETREDFMAVIENRDEIQSSSSLDEVSISLLIAAKNQILLYDISKWGEDVGVASKATFSRTKTQLEDLGIIDTEKVPIDVGRPRLRLKLVDESMTEMSADEMVEEIEQEVAA